MAWEVVSSVAAAVDVAAYRRVTRDADSDDAAVEEALADATGEVEGFLHRPVDRGVYRERLRIVYDQMVAGFFGTSGWVYPSACPVWSVSSPTGTDVAADQITVRNVTPDSDPIAIPVGTSMLLDRYSTVTYEGGWDPASVPFAVTRVVCRVARLLVPSVLASTPVLPAGAVSARVGDVQVTYGSAADAYASLPSGVRASLRPYRKRRV